MQRPGCAFTRSIGDGVAEHIGVTAEPEQLIRQIDEDSVFVVVASDGVWEFMTSQHVIDDVDKFKGDNAPLEACKKVVSEAYRLWLQYEIRTDDITMIVLRFDDFKPVNDGQGSETSTGTSTPAGRQSKTILLQGLSASSGHIQRPVRRTLSKAKRRLIVDHQKSGVGELAEKFVLLDHIQEKTKEEFERIEGWIATNFLFHHMTPKQKKDAVSCMERIEVKEGQAVIVQGNEGDKFYIVDSGKYDVLVRDEDGVMQSVFGYSEPGSSFGELSLMYSKPRAATIKALCDGGLWGINRVTFRACMLKRNSHTDLISILKKVEILKLLSIPQMQRLCDLFAEEEYEAGAFIVKQGDEGENLYIVEEGECVCTKQEGDRDVEMMRLGPNDYFGERALMYDESRAANVTAVGHVKVLTMGRKAFEEVVGSLETVISNDQQRREEKKNRINRMSTYRNFHSDKESSLLCGATRESFKPRVLASGTVGSETGTFGCFTHFEGKVPIMYGLKVFNKIQCLGDDKKGGMAKTQERERLILGGFEVQSPFVPVLLATFQTDYCCYSVFKSPLVVDLASLMVDNKFDEQKTKFYIACVVLALEFCGKVGLMVRMVEPGSIMLGGNGYPVLHDFRMAKKMDGQRSFTMCGELLYMAPEMVTGEGYDFAIDCWALGVMGCSMMGGKNPFGDDVSNETAVYKAISGWQESSVSAHLGACGVEASADCIDLFAQLTRQTASDRLGANGVLAIMEHKWFEDVDWEKLKQQKGWRPRLKESEPPHKEECYTMLAEGDKEVAGLEELEAMESKGPCEDTITYATFS